MRHVALTGFSAALLAVAGWVGPMDELVAATDATPAAAASAASAAPAARPAGQPPAECLAELDRLSLGIPREETGPLLRSRGLWIKTPIIVPDGAITDRSVISAARVRVMVDAQGQVVPGSVVVQQSVGDPKLALAMSDAVPASLSFDVSRASSVPKEFPFTTVYLVCASP